MNRRDFLRGAALTAAGVAVVGGELLLPDRKIFLPPRGGWPVVGRHFAYHNFAAGLDPAFCSVQNAEWAPMYPQTAAEFNAGVYPDDVSYPPGDARRYRTDPRLRDLFAYATQPHSGPLNLDIIVGPG